MSRELADLGTTVELRPARRGRRLAVIVAVALVAGAAAVRAGDEEDAALDQLVLPPATAEEPAVTAAPDTEDVAAAALPAPAVTLPPLGRVGDLELWVPAEEAVLVSYHEAAFPEAMDITPFGEVSANENPTRPIAPEAREDGNPFHVQVSRGRANGPTTAVDVVLLPGEEVRAPVAGTITEVRPYQLYGTHDDVRIELVPDAAPDRAVVLIHVEDVQVRAGDRVAAGDVLAGSARLFPFAAVVDRQTEPDRYGHVHLEVKVPLEGDDGSGQ